MRRRGASQTRQPGSDLPGRSRAQPTERPGAHPTEQQGADPLERQDADLTGRISADLTGRTIDWAGRRRASPRGRRGASLTGRRVAAALAALTVLAQIAYPLSTGETLRVLTIATVLLFAAASVLHAAATRGARAALILLVVAGGIGLLAEAVGVRTGVPFGRYEYARSLGPKLLEVPLIVPLAWVMMAYPCLLLGRRFARSYARATRRARIRHGGLPPGAVAVLAGAVTLAAWDLFLDPQMVAAGHWTWANPAPALPGVPGVPLTNYAGWLAVALVLMTLLHLVFPHAPRAPEDVPGALLAWTWAGSTLGNAAFFDRPTVAAWGGVVMGLLVVPYLLLWWDGRP